MGLPCPSTAWVCICSVPSPVTFTKLVYIQVVLVKLYLYVSGVLKVLQMILNIITAICIACVRYCGGNNCSSVSFMQFTCISSLIFSITLFILFALTFHLKIEIINWPLTDLVHSTSYGCLHLIGSIWLAATTTSESPAQSAAAFFGFCSLFVYVASAYFALQNFRLHQRKHHAPVSHIKGVSGNLG